MVRPQVPSDTPAPLPRILSPAAGQQLDARPQHLHRADARALAPTPASNASRAAKPAASSGHCDRDDAEIAVL